MARYTEAVCRQCRREGQKLFLKGDRCYTQKCALECRGYAPGQHGQGRSKTSEYGSQLREKQKVRRYYGVLEKQFQAVLGIVDVVVRGKFGFHAGFARDGSDNDCGAVFVSDIVLDDYDRAVALLLRADAPAQIGVIHIAAQICVAHSVMTSFVYLGVPTYVEIKQQNRIKVGER